MIKRIKSIIDGFRAKLDANHQILLEIEWANIYHDSIRGNEMLQNLSLKIGRWAGGYSFMYLTHRILVDFRPKKIVEFGLGESSKFISTYNQSIGNYHEHIVIEQDEKWKNIFNENFHQDNINIAIHPLVKKNHNSYEYNGYQNIDDIPTDGDFYLIDGPFGTPHYSRYDIVRIIERFEKDKEFVLILDDYNRKGEQETAEEIKNTCRNRGINFKSKEIKGKKSQFVLVTSKYEYVLTL